MAKDKNTDIGKITEGLIQDMKGELDKQKALMASEDSTVNQLLRKYGKEALVAAGCGAAVGIPLPVIGPISGAILGGGSYMIWRAYSSYKKTKKTK